MTASHIMLNIVWGLPVAPADPFPVEKGVNFINLLATNGFALDTQEGWVPQIAPIKNGGLFTDNPISDGEQLIFAAAGNVDETMTLIAHSATLDTRQALLAKLNRYGQLAQEFWELGTQPDPVYLEWQAPGAPAPQYALVYTIEVAEQDDPFSAPYVELGSRLVITLQREPYWRALPPGDNPKKWYFYTQGMEPGVDYQYDDLSLVNGSDHFIAQTIDNKTELDILASGAALTQNYLDIVAARVPGDAPALICATVVNTTAGNTFPNRLFLGKSRVDLNVLAQTGVATFGTYDFGQPAGGSGFVSTVGTATTGLRNTAAGSFLFGRSSLAAGDVQYPSNGGTGDSTNFSNTAYNFLRGTFSIFVRGRANAGATGDVRIRVTYFENSNSRLQFNEVSVPAPTAGAGYELIYIGQISLPQDSETFVGTDGRGMTVDNAFAGQFILEDRNTSGAARVFDLMDLILIPIENVAAQIIPSTPSGVVAGSGWVLADNTGYFARNKRQYAGVFTDTGGTQRRFSAELRGGIPTLTPGIDQRLYFLNECENAVSVISSRPDAQMTVRLNIVPRWTGVRDV